MAFSDGPKVSVVTRSLVRIAQPAQRLQVVRIVGAPVLARIDVIDIQRPFVGADATEFTSEPGPFQRLVSKTARSLAENNRPMLPNGRPTLDSVRGYRVV